CRVAADQAADAGRIHHGHACQIDHQIARAGGNGVAPFGAELLQAIAQRELAVELQYGDASLFSQRNRHRAASYTGVPALPKPRAPERTIDLRSEEHTSELQSRGH